MIRANLRFCQISANIDVDVRNVPQGQLLELPFANEVEQEAADELHRVEGISIREQDHFKEGLRWPRTAWTVLSLNLNSHLFCFIHIGGGQFIRFESSERTFSGSFEPVGAAQLPPVRSAEKAAATAPLSFLSIMS